MVDHFSHVDTVQTSLLARGALSYRPSLSWAVRDALYGLWRLPGWARRRLLSCELDGVLERNPNVTSRALAVSIDWDRLESAIARASDGEAPWADVHVAWALAYQAEAAVDAFTSTETWVGDELAPGVGILAHHRTLPRLLRRHLAPDVGEFYVAFVVLITILEKGLYDLYHHHHRSNHERAGATEEDSGDDDDAVPRTGPREQKKKNMILRDLLQSETLQRALPTGMMRLLRLLFLPTGLNLRNLVWHGFLIPAELPRCVGCLALVLVLQLPAYFGQDPTHVTSEGGASPLFDLGAFDERFVVSPKLRVILEDVTSMLPQLVSLGTEDLHHSTPASSSASTSESSSFVPRGREGLVQLALEALQVGDELTFHFAILPVLEHALREEFVRVNRQRWGLSTRYREAQIDEYYSTLDGFGQRDKHQVLLHPEVLMRDVPDLDGDHADGLRLNELYRTLPTAALAVCLDLFMMATGPNVRAKLCHGEADLANFDRRSCTDAPSPPTPSIITTLLLLAWLSLVRSHIPEAADAESGQHNGDAADLIRRFGTHATSSFHPFLQLQRKYRACVEELDRFTRLHKTWTRFKMTTTQDDLDAKELLVTVRFDHDDDIADHEGSRLISITEKHSRLSEYQHLLELLDPPIEGLSLKTLESTAPPAKTTSAKHPSVGERLALLYRDLRAIRRELQGHFSTHHPTEEDTDAPAMGRAFQLALGDADGLSVSSCMLDILGSIHRALSTCQTRVRTLGEMLEAGRARTNHRRSFLVLIFSLPVFGLVQETSLLLVRHQLVRLRETARRNAGLRVGTGESCMVGKDMEQLQRKLLQFITAFEGCTGSPEASQKSNDKATQLAAQFFASKPLRALRHRLL